MAHRFPSPFNSVEYAVPIKIPRMAQKQLLGENDDLRARLEQAEYVLRVIHDGEVDALVVPGVNGEQIFSLQGADHSYRVLVEQMGEGAATLSVAGDILYCNHRFAEMVATPLEQVIGKNINAFVCVTDRAELNAAVKAKLGARQEIECGLATGTGTSTTARLALVFLPLETLPVFCLTAADLTNAKRKEKELDQARENLEERVAERTMELEHEIVERKQMESQLKEMCIHEELTGLYNRRFFDEEIIRLGRGRQFPISIFMADVNDLKGTNDRNGHAEGDAMLQRAAQVLNDTFRADDIIARIGGDEFAVLLPTTNAASAQQLLCRVRRTMDKSNAANDGTPLSIALGISTTGQGGSLTDGLKEADARMYLDKHGS
jgi:diguanylate cyclase (GGDEF)-like protein/PAS domain S-box-containing protein